MFTAFPKDQNFSPSLFECRDLEIAVFKLEKGHQADGHFHKTHTEYNYIIRGQAQIGEKLLGAGDFFIYEPYDKAFVKYLEDTDLLVIKTPSVKNDKYY